MDGFLLHGVDYIQVLDLEGKIIEIHGNGRVYTWSSGAATVYFKNEPWRFYPPHRVYGIIGKENG